MKRSDDAMRPIDRGPAPAAYADYRDALGDLEQRLGRYCSYCERPLGIGLAVEHKAPKSTHPDRALDWDNFLLGCVNCNSVKGDKDLGEGDTLWPDEHNTFLAVAYENGGFVGVSSELDGDLASRARTLIDLVGLDRHLAQGFPPPAPRDRRWQQREEAWAAANSVLRNYERLNRSPHAMDMVVKAALAHGFFSVWLTVFAGFPDIKSALVQRFKGTAATCFDPRGRPVSRTALGV